MSLVSNLLTLPSHLIENIQTLLNSDIDLPKDLETDLQNALNNATNNPSEPATINLKTIENLSKWAISETGQKALNSKHLQPSTYTQISLLSGTKLHLTPNQEKLLPKTHQSTIAYLPSYLSPPPPTVIQEYRTTIKQLSTTLNVLFSIFGSSTAVYIASVTGGGYCRETGVILAVLTGCLVGLAEGVLVWIVSHRNEVQGEVGRRELKGSSGEGLKVLNSEKKVEDEEGEKVVVGVTEMVEGGTTAVEKRTIRLRRRGVGE